MTSKVNLSVFDIDPEDAKDLPDGTLAIIATAREDGDDLIIEIQVPGGDIEYAAMMSYLLNSAISKASESAILKDAENGSSS